MVRPWWIVAIGFTLAGSSPAGAVEPPADCYLIGNSLTWDTVPSRLAGRVRWHVDCGVSLPHIRNHPEKPCVKDSSIWPRALVEGRYRFVSVQPHYGSSLAEDLDAISAWMAMQPDAVFVIHSGWAFHVQLRAEYDNCDIPARMAHNPAYMRALVAELSARHPGREIRQTLAQNYLALVAEDAEAGRAPFGDASELYRDAIHMTHGAGKYLMHNAMRRALGQSRSAAGFDGVPQATLKYLDSVLALADTTAGDRELLKQVLSTVTTTDRRAIAGKLSDPGLRKKVEMLLPEIDKAARSRRAHMALEAEVKEAGGRMSFVPTGPQWLYLATGDKGTEVFDVPSAIDLYNGNNPLKGKGGRNERVTDDWLKRLSGATTLRKIDLANCAITSDGLRHLAELKGLREINLTLTPVDDRGLKHLSGMEELRVLGLASTRCDGTGFRHLMGLRKLESVNFHFTPVNDAGLAAIALVPNSGRFWFAHTRFTDAGAANLAAMTGLKRVGIGSTDKASSGAAVAHLAAVPLEDLALLDNQATPEGLAHAAKIQSLKRLDASHAPMVKDDSLELVAGMPRLEELVLGSAGVTDAGLQSLSACKSLKKLTILGAKGVTPAGMEALRKSRPGLNVEIR